MAEALLAAEKRNDGARQLELVAFELADARACTETHEVSMLPPGCERGCIHWQHDPGLCPFCDCGKACDDVPPELIR